MCVRMVDLVSCINSDSWDLQSFYYLYDRFIPRRVVRVSIEYQGLLETLPPSYYRKLYEEQIGVRAVPRQEV
jgi:hypothetical protein